MFELDEINRAVEKINRILLLINNLTKNTDLDRAIDDALAAMTNFQIDELHAVRQALE